MVEEQAVAAAERHLHEVVGEVVGEALVPVGHEAQVVLVGEGEQAGRPGLHRHLRVRDRALEGEEHRGLVHGDGVAGGVLVGEEAEVVVAVRPLGVAARVDHVDLRRHPVARAQPRLAHHVEHGVGEVVDVDVRRLLGQLLEGVPDAVVRPRLGEVVTGVEAGRPFGLDDAPVDVGRPVDDLRIHHALDGEHARAVEQAVVELGHDRPAGLGCRRRRPEHGGVVHAAPAATMAEALGTSAGSTSCSHSARNASRSRSAFDRNAADRWRP